MPKELTLGGYRQLRPSCLSSLNQMLPEEILVTEQSLFIVTNHEPLIFYWKKAKLCHQGFLPSTKFSITVFFISVSNLYFDKKEKK